MIVIATTATRIRGLVIIDYSDGLALGALVGLGYLTPMNVNIAINPLIPRPFYYALLNVPFVVVGSLMSSKILVALS